MTRLKTMILGGLVGAFVMIQFIQPDRNDSGQVSKQSLTALYHVPDNVTQILQQSCANCHSNNTAYPWLVGKPKDGDPKGCYVLLHINEQSAVSVKESIQVEFIRFRYDVEEAAKAIEESILPDKYGEGLRNAF